MLIELMFRRFGSRLEATRRQGLRLSSRGEPGAAAGPLRDAAPEAADASALQQEEDIPRCGWFDSSHELEHGLQVQEHAADTAAAALATLDLGDWLDFELRHLSAAVA